MGQQQALTNILNFNEGVYSGVVFLREFSPSTKDAVALFCADVVGIPSVPITVKKNHSRDAMVSMNNLNEGSLAVEKLSFQYILDEGDPDQGTDWFNRIMATLLCHDDVQRLSVMLMITKIILLLKLKLIFKCLKMKMLIIILHW